jgi:HPt (histidine-containing phosphotransfer) domain-containing protein
VHKGEQRAATITGVLADANHSVLRAAGLEEAVDALLIEKFDAVLVESHFTRKGLAEFSAKLRTISNQNRFSTRVPVIVLDSDEGLDYCCDAVMPEPIDPYALTQTVLRLAQAVSSVHTKEEAQRDAAGLAVIEVKKFEEQLGEDPELKVEIIDLFLEERRRQEPEMQAALETRQFERVSRLAHTIKGSLSSLYATRARYHAQELELAAKQGQEESSWAFFSALKADLAELEPELLNLRIDSV